MDATDTRISQILSEAPPWAQLLTSLVIATTPPETLDKVMEVLHPKSPDWGEQVLPNHRLLDFNGLTRRQALRVLKGDRTKLERVEHALARHGIAMVDDLPTHRATRQEAIAPVAPPPVADESDPEIAPGHRRSSLVGRPVAELLKIEGISPAMARKLSAATS